jgi:hypothetical protein
MDRGIKDEGFVRRGLGEADFDCGRWVANQAHFNGPDDSVLPEKTRAALITVVAVFVEKYHWDEQCTADAIAVKTCGQARALIDRLRGQLPDVRPNIQGGAVYPRHLETLLRLSRSYGIRGVLFAGDVAQRQIERFVDALIERQAIGAADREQTIDVLSRELVDLRHLTPDAAVDAIRGGCAGLLS